MRTHRPITPIELMVDRSAGHARSGSWIRLSVPIRCPRCGWRDAIVAHEAYPDATALIEIACPKCNGGKVGEPRFLDAEGKEIP